MLADFTASKAHQRKARNRYRQYKKDEIIENVKDKRTQY
jgi:uncharacterized protein (UPF0297 family)